MTIMTRVIRIFRADLHGVMDQLEDKRLLLKQHVRDLEVDLQQKEARLKQFADNARQILADRQIHQREVDKLERDLDSAIRRSKDDIARLLIRKKRVRQKQCDWLQAKHDALQEEHDRLRGILEDQQLRYATLKVRVAAFQEKHREADRPGSDPDPLLGDDWFSVGEEDIELELMQRKEQLQETGGGA